MENSNKNASTFTSKHHLLFKYLVDCLPNMGCQSGGLKCQKSYQMEQKTANIVYKEILQNILEQFL